MGVTPFDPEPISEALFSFLSSALVASAVKFQEMSRRPAIGQNVEIGKRPAFYLTQQRINITNPGNKIPIYQIHYMVFIAAWDNQSDQMLPETFLNQVFTIITNALIGTPPGNKITLGGLITSLYIEGDSPIVQGIVPTQELWRLIPIIAKSGI